jgi:4'-phosphopantetheinyl transferase
MATATVRTPAHISLARAGSLSIVAVTDAGPIGIDVERDGAAHFEGFGDVALHRDEVDTPEESTRTWVRKEALLKAYGRGLEIDPRHVHIDARGLLAWESAHPEPNKVWMRDLPITDHVAAVVVLPRAGTDVAHLSPEVRRFDATTAHSARTSGRG